jgi:hypothetical protein
MIDGIGNGGQPVVNDGAIGAPQGKDRERSSEGVGKWLCTISVGAVFGRG